MLPRLLAATLLSAAMLLVGAAAAHAKPRLVPLLFHGELGAVQATDLDCPPPPTGATLVELTGTTLFGTEPGDNVVGTDTWEACFHLLPDGSTRVVQGKGRFDGAIQGCGEGSIELVFSGTIGAPDQTGARASRDVVRFVAGSGSGGLARVVGGYVAEGIIEPDLSFREAVARGSVLC